MVTEAVLAALVGLSPVVVEDSRERAGLGSVATAPVPAVIAERDRRPAVYGRVAAGADGGAWVQYWLYYPRQDQDRGILRTGRHAGDWEMVQYRVDRGGRPLEAVYAQHSGAERCPWRRVERRGGRPVVYAARGSHASYFGSGTRDRTWPDPNDEANGRGRVLRPRLVRISETSPAWMRWPGHWGAARARWWVPGEQDSPRGPAFQPQGRWRDPGAWSRAAASCRTHCDRADECDGPERALGLGGAAASAAVLGGAWLRRRRRRRTARR